MRCQQMKSERQADRAQENVKDDDRCLSWDHLGRWEETGARAGPEGSFEAGGSCL